jgi:hypothetical protein
LVLAGRATILGRKHAIVARAADIGGKRGDARLMTLRCDHCRRPLGVVVYYYWRMRFCSAACRQAYERRLQEDTRAKIRRLDGARQAQPAIARESPTWPLPFPS